MSDFHQHGSITTLHRLADSQWETAEPMLLMSASHRHIALVLPCHADDFVRPALRKIRRELEDAAWLRNAFLVWNGIPQPGGNPAEAGLGGITAVRSDGDAARQFGEGLRDRGLIPPALAQPSKGWNVWLGLGLALAAGADVIAVHDADIASYRREMLGRLCLPVAHTGMQYAFAKGYYRRVTEGVMFGRVTRLFVAPLVRACIRVCGHHPLLDHIAAFRYPLAGECALDAATAADLPLAPGWGLEIAMLCETHARLPGSRVCQVELGPNYEHKHRPLAGEAGGLVGMAGEIARTFLAGLHAEGISLDPATREALLSTFERTSAEAVQRHAHDALLNGLDHDEAGEADATVAFGEALRKALETAAEPPSLLPAWKRVLARWPEAFEVLRGLR